MVKNLPVNARDTGSIPGLRTSLEQEMATHSSPGECHGQRSLVGYSPQGHKELDMPDHAHMHTPYFCNQTVCQPVCINEVTLVILTKSSDIPVLSHLCSSST